MALFEIVTGIIMTFHWRVDSEPHRDVYRDLNSLSLAGRWRPLKYMLAGVCSSIVYKWASSRENLSSVFPT